MTVDEITGRLIAVETIAMMALGLYLSNSRNDADYQKASALLNHMREAIAESAKTQPQQVQVHAARYGQELLDAVSQNLRALRGEGGQLN